MAIIGIIALVAVPAMQSMINASRLNSAEGELTAALQLARSEAVRRNTIVRVCGNAACSLASWNEAVVVQPNPTADDPAVMRSVAAPAGVTFTGPVAGVTFRPSGLLDGEVELSACMPTTTPPDNQRVLTVRVSGAISYEKRDGGGSC